MSSGSVFRPPRLGAGRLGACASLRSSETEAPCKSPEGQTQRAKSKRRARVAAPGARRVTFTGIMAVPDDFGRLRVLLIERFADGTPDGSWAALAREFSRAGGGLPYELREGGADADGVRGTVRVAVPVRYRAHWGRVAESLRGQEVRVEATVRPYTFQPDAETSPGGEAQQATVSGVALDLAVLEARENRAAPSGEASAVPL